MVPWLGFNTTAIDVNHDSRAAGLSCYIIHFCQLDATAMAEEDAYDCIGSFDVIEHIEADERVLSSFKRDLRTGGLHLLALSQPPWLWSAADDYAHHVRRYTVQELRRKVLHAGFRIEYCT